MGVTPPPLVLAVDVGNTQTVLGLFRAGRIRKKWRIPSRAASLSAFPLRTIGHPQTVVVSSVVPPLKSALSQFGKALNGKTPLFIGPDDFRGNGAPIRVAVPSLRRVGPDRLVNAVAAHAQFRARWKANLIVVDLGTATTFDAITRDGVFLGGAIAPGLGIARDALAERCSLLPRVPIAKTSRAIGRTTKRAMQAGLFLGYVGLVDGLVERIKKELGEPVKVIMTGGLSTIVAPSCQSVDDIDPDLTLKGLYRLALLRNL